jgi:hypothetical protein
LPPPPRSGFAFISVSRLLTHQLNPLFDSQSIVRTMVAIFRCLGGLETAEISRRKAFRRKAFLRKAFRRKASRRKASRRKASRRKASRRKASRRQAPIVRGSSYHHQSPSPSLPLQSFRYSQCGDFSLEPLTKQEQET